MRRSVSLLLNIAHAIDHLFLLIFATAVGAIAHDFGLARWEDLMPYGAGAFLLFGLGSLPAGKLGDQWGRRQMMLVFFLGMGASALLIAATTGPWQLAGALTLMGAFASIYHPVGIPMLVQHADKPGAAIGVNGLAGNLGIAAAAIVTGFLVEHAGWRAAFAVPGLACFAVGALFWWRAPRETEPPAQRTRKTAPTLPPGQLTRVLLVMTMASASGGLIFNLTTNGNGQMLGERLSALANDPSRLGLLLGAVYAVASVAQVIVGRLIDRYPLKPIWLVIVLAQVPMLAAAAVAPGWWAWLALLGSMVFIFGAIPFTDATIVRFVDDRMRSRVAGLRLAV
jgi:MFS family permease